MQNVEFITSSATSTQPFSDTVWVGRDKLSRLPVLQSPSASPCAKCALGLGHKLL